MSFRRKGWVNMYVDIVEGHASYGHALAILYRDSETDKVLCFCMKIIIE